MNKVILALGVTVIPLSGVLIQRWIGKGGEKEVQKRRYVGIELGGTNYNVAVGEPIVNNKGEIVDFKIIKRRNGNTYQDPTQTLKDIIEFIESNNNSSIQENPENTLYFIGIASFGPLCLDKSSKNYGTITTTPKELWRNVQVLEKLTSPFQNTLRAIDTDVNSAAFAQFKLGQHGVKESLAYITVGTGVGVGVICNGKTVHGLTHPEGGHIIGERHPHQYEDFFGVCPFHKKQTCIEGMVCNKAIAGRLKADFTALAEVSQDARVWKLVGYYLAQLCLNITLLVSPQVIVIGGGIMNRGVIYRFIHQQFIRMLADYVDHPLLKSGAVDKYIVAPKLGADVGIKGAMALSFM